MAPRTRKKAVAMVNSPMDMIVPAPGEEPKIPKMLIMTLKPGCPQAVVQSAGAVFVKHTLYKFPDDDPRMKEWRNSGFFDFESDEGK